MEEKTYCPVCERADVQFSQLPDFYRQEAVLHGYRQFGRSETIALDRYACMTCGAADHERLYAWWINAQTESGALYPNTTLS